MKRNRLFAMLLCICLLSTPFAALAAPGDTSAFVQPFDPENPYGNSDFYAEQIVKLDDAYFARGQDKMMRWQEGMTDAEVFCSLAPFPDAFWGVESYDKAPDDIKAQVDAYVTDIAAGDGKIWAYNNFAGRIGEITKDGVKWLDVKPDMTDMSYSDGMDDRVRQRSVSNLFVADGGLYMLRDNYSADNPKDNRVLVRFDLTTGAQTKIVLEDAQMVSAYKPGQLLTLGVAYDEKRETIAGTFTTLDLASGKETAMPLELTDNDLYGVGGLAYDAASDSIYLCFKKQVWKSEKGQPFVSVAYLTQANGGSFAPAWILPNNMYALGSGGLYICNVDPQYKAARALHISGSWEDTNYLNFSSQNPDVPVLFDSYPTDAESVAKAITSGGNMSDIYVMYVDQGMRDLINKGFAADLSASAAISQNLEAMYPQIKNALYDANGKPMAFPRSINFGPWTVNVTLWEQFNMGPLPTTYSQLFDYFKRWQDELADENSDINFFESAYDDSALSEIVIQNYILQYEKSGEPVDFNSPVLRKVLQQIADLKLEKIDTENMNDEERAELDERRSHPAIFYMYNNLGLFYDPNTTQYVSSDPRSGASSDYRNVKNILPMVFEEGQTPIIRAQMEVMIANPASPNLDLALKYIDFYAQNGMDKYARYMLRPDLNDPVETKNFAEDVKRTQETLADCQEQLKVATDSDQKRDLTDTIDYLTRWLNEQDKNKWDLSAAGIAHYREFAQYMSFSENSMFLKAGENSPLGMLRELLTRYSDGQLSLDAFLTELNNKMSMMVLEGQ